MSRTLRLCAALAAVAILLPIAGEARPVIRSITPKGTTPTNPQDRVIRVKGNRSTPLGVWINRRSDCQTLAMGPDFGGIADANGDYTSDPESLEAKEAGVAPGDIVCVGPRRFFQRPKNGPRARCDCKRVR